MKFTSSYPDFLEYTGYGDVSGLCGANCRHSFGAFFPEIMEPPHSDQDLKEQSERDKKTKIYEYTDKRGVKHKKEFTLREAIDRQNELARQMRITRSLLMAYKAAKLQEAYQDAYVDYQKQSKEYTAFSKTMGIDEQREKITMDGLGRMLKWKSEWN